MIPGVGSGYIVTLVLLVCYKIKKIIKIICYCNNKIILLICKRAREKKPHTTGGQKMRQIETKKGLAALLERMDSKKKQSRERLPEFEEWRAVVVGCIAEGLAMDQTDYENAPHWFRVLWVGLK